MAIQSLASDLKRIALGIQRNSLKMAQRFSEEALKRKSEINLEGLPGYIVDILKKLDQAQRDMKTERIAEDYLMYSTLLQNYAQARCQK